MTARGIQSLSGLNASTSAACPRVVVDLGRARRERTEAEPGLLPQHVHAGEQAQKKVPQKVRPILVRMYSSCPESDVGAARTGAPSMPTRSSLSGPKPGSVAEELPHPGDERRVRSGFRQRGVIKKLAERIKGGVAVCEGNVKHLLQRHRPVGNAAVLAAQVLLRGERPVQDGARGIHQHEPRQRPVQAVLPCRISRKGERLLECAPCPRFSCKDRSRSAGSRRSAPWRSCPRREAPARGPCRPLPSPR